MGAVEIAEATEEGAEDSTVATEEAEETSTIAVAEDATLEEIEEVAAAVISIEAAEEISETEEAEETLAATVEVSEAAVVAADSEKDEVAVVDHHHKTGEKTAFHQNSAEGELTSLMKAREGASGEPHVMTTEDTQEDQDRVLQDGQDLLLVTMTTDKQQIHVNNTAGGRRLAILEIRTQCSLYQFISYQ